MVAVAGVVVSVVEVEFDPLLLLLDIELHRFDSNRLANHSDNPASPSSFEIAGVAGAIVVVEMPSMLNLYL